MDSQLFSTFFAPSLKRGNINTRPKSFIKKNKWWERGTVAIEGGRRGFLVGYTFLTVCKLPQNFLFYPWKFQTGNSIQLHPSKILRPKTNTTENFVWCFLDHACKFHIVFDKSLEVLLTISLIFLKTPILLILFLFPNMLLPTIHTPKRIWESLY